MQQSMSSGSGVMLIQVAAVDGATSRYYYHYVLLSLLQVLYFTTSMTLTPVRVGGLEGKPLTSTVLYYFPDADAGACRWSTRQSGDAS